MCLRCAMKSYDPVYQRTFARSEDKLGFCPKCDKKVLIPQTDNIRGRPLIYILLLYLLEFILVPGIWVIKDCKIYNEIFDTLIVFGAAFLVVSCLLTILCVDCVIVNSDGDSNNNRLLYRFYGVIPFWALHVAIIIGIISSHVFGMIMYNAYRPECINYPNIITFLVGVFPGTGVTIIVLALFAIGIKCAARCYKYEKDVVRVCPDGLI